MHAQRVCIIAAYPVLRLCDASNNAALSAHDVSNTELPHEFVPISLSMEIPYTILEGLHLSPEHPYQWLRVAIEKSKKFFKFLILSAIYRYIIFLNIFFY